MRALDWPVGVDVSIVGGTTVMTGRSNPTGAATGSAVAGGGNKDVSLLTVLSLALNDDWER